MTTVRRTQFALRRSVRLFVIATACLTMRCTQAYEDPTALRLAVYSDATLAYVEATLLDEQERPTTITRRFATPADARADTTFLFAMLVERTAESENREYAVVRFDGYVSEQNSPRLVLQRTVRAHFADHETKLARVWLARSCAAYDSESPTCPRPTDSCAYETASCQPHAPALTTESYASTTDDKARWVPSDYPASCETGFDDCDGDFITNGCETDLNRDPQHCGTCGGPRSSCHYGVCERGECLGTQIPISSMTGTRTMPAGELYLKQVRNLTDLSILALGVHVSNASGGRAHLILAADEGKRPGRILAAKEVVLVESTTDSQGSFGSETRLDSPVHVSPGEFWVGVVFSQHVLVSVTRTMEGSLRMVSTALVNEFDPNQLPELTVSQATSEPLVYAVAIDPTPRD